MSTKPEEPIEILLVEDNPGDVRLTKEAFNQLSTETSIDVAIDGTEAIDVLSARKASDSAPLPDLVLLDLNLPRMGGFEFLETIRDDSTLSSLPVVVLTSSKATEDVLECYELSANAYLTKPTDPTEFEEMVEAAAEFWFERAALPPIES